MRIAKWSTVYRPFAAMLIILAISCMHVAADDHPVILERRTDGHNIVFYLGHTGKSTVKVKIGSAAADYMTTVDDADSLEVDTWILVDNSLSIKSDDREKTKQLLKSLTSGMLKNESISLCTISEHLNPLLKHCTDQNVINSEIDSLSYDNQETYLTDVLSELLNLLETEHNSGYVRIFVISDGVDNNAQGITRAELNAQLNRISLPIYTVGCRGNAQELKELYALSRTTNARNWSFAEIDEVSAIAATVQQEELPVYGIVTIPENMQDGSIKGVQLTFEDGTVLDTQVNMPFGETISQPEPAEDVASESIIEQDPEPEEEPVVSELQSEDLESQKTTPKKLSFFPVIIFGLVLLCAGGVLLWIKSRKRTTPELDNAVDENQILNQMPQQAEAQWMPQPPPSPWLGAQDSGEEYGDGTVVMGAENWEETVVDGIGRQHVILSLQDLQFPSAHFELILPHTISLAGETGVADMIRIGRAPENDIVINYNKTVSAYHCKITVSGPKIFVCDLGSKNGTTVNGVTAQKGYDIPASNGCIIQLGDVSLRLGLIERSTG